MNKQDTPQSVNRPLIIALIFALIGIVGGVIMMASVLPQITPLADNSGIATLAVLIFIGIMLVVSLAIRFFQLAEKSSLDDE